jgi:predicted nucleic acid-binding protein
MNPTHALRPWSADYKAEMTAVVADGLLVCPLDLCEHHARERELVRKYRDQPMDLADACLVAMSEKWWECRVVTVDASDFQVYRRRGRHPIPLLTPASG